MSAEEFDVVVLGGGPAGENAADRVVAGGLTVALVEAQLAGGECSYWACMPSKALLRPLEVIGAAGRLDSTRAALTGALDVEAALRRRDEFTGYDRSTHRHDDSGQAEWITGLPAEFVRGHGRISAPRTVEVGTGTGPRTLRARHAVIVATGTTAVVPPIEGLADARPWTSREVTSTESVPERLVVLGGGVVGSEMAYAMRGLGAREVTMIVRGESLLERMEPFARSMVREAFESAGITVRTGVSATRVVRGDDGSVTVTTDTGETVIADEILVATGRAPATADIGLDTVGLSPGKPVDVDDSLRATGADGGWLYAVGDANGRNLLTHMGKYQARIAGEVIVARSGGRSDDHPSLRASADAFGAPQVVFTDPEACAVGLTEAAAREKGLDVRVVEYDLASVAGASLQADGYTGRAKAVIDTAEDVFVGVTFVGPGVAELLHAATIAVTARVPLEQLWHAVPAYPTVSEIWLRLLETARDQ